MTITGFRYSVSSSHVLSVGSDGEDLIVTFKARKETAEVAYRYFKAGHLALPVANSPSVGKALQELVYDKFDYSRLAPTVRI